MPRAESPPPAPALKSSQKSLRSPSTTRAVYLKKLELPPCRNRIVVLHIVFSTKNRQKLITPPHREPLHALLAARVRELGCECYRVGGGDDHVHLAVRLGSKMTVAQLIEKIKVPTSIWMKRRAPSLSHFSWQNGYGAFSVSPPYLDDLLHYIDHQEAHHAQSSFENELRGFLHRYQIAYDERYVWD